MGCCIWYISCLVMDGADIGGGGLFKRAGVSMFGEDGLIRFVAEEVVEEMGGMIGSAMVIIGGCVLFQCEVSFVNLYL